MSHWWARDPMDSDDALSQPNSSETSQSPVNSSKMTDGVMTLEIEDPKPEQKIPKSLSRRALDFFSSSIETQGIEPTPEHERVDKRLYQLFIFFFANNFNLVAFSAGTSGPTIYGLGFYDSIFIIMVGNLIFAAIPAFMSIFGPKLGVRGMVLARFSWGYYGAKIPSTLTMFSEQGFVILNAVVGSHILATISPKIDKSLCVFVMGTMTLIVTIFGCKVIHKFETYAWIPNAFSFLFLLYVGRKELQLAKNFHYEHPPLSSMISFLSLVAAWFICYPNTADYGIYHDHKSPSWKTFLYSYFGFVLGSGLPQMLGAAFASATTAIPAWNGLSKGSSLGSLIGAILEPTGVYGKIFAGIMSVALLSGSAPTMYSTCTCAMSISKSFSRIPQWCFPIISYVVLVPIGMLGTHHFYSTLVDVFAFAGYWIAAFLGIILMDHIVIRVSNYSTYNVQDFDNHRKLPSWIPAFCAFILSFFLIVPCMSHDWYIGPIAKLGVGDIGIFVGMVGAALLYCAFKIEWKLLLKPIIKYVCTLN